MPVSMRLTSCGPIMPSVTACIYQTGIRQSDEAIVSITLVSGGQRKPPVTGYSQQRLIQWCLYLSDCPRRLLLLANF